MGCNCGCVCVDANAEKLSEVIEKYKNTEGRITSYNVCYTKLLRITEYVQSHGDPDSILIQIQGPRITPLMNR